MNKFTVMIVAGVLAAGLMGMPLVFAHENEDAREKSQRFSVHIEKNGHVQLTGKLTLVASTTLTVASWGGSWTVDAAGAKTIGKLEVGKPVMVQGQASESGMTITAKIVRGEAEKKVGMDKKKEGHEKKREKIAEFVSEHGSTTIAELKPGILQKIFRLFKQKTAD